MGGRTRDRLQGGPEGRAMPTGGATVDLPVLGRVGLKRAAKWKRPNSAVGTRGNPGRSAG